MGGSGRRAIRFFAVVGLFATVMTSARGTQAGRSRDPSPAPSASDPLGERVLVIYNSNERDSKRLADHYAEVRAVPARNVMGVAFTNRDELDWSEYTGGIRRAIQARLDDPKLLYVVLSYLTPWRMVNSPLPQCWQDRIGLYRVGDPDQAPALGWKTTDSSKSGSLSWPAPTQPGTYEYRLFQAGKTPVTRSPSFTVNGNGTVVPVQSQSKPKSKPTPSDAGSINTLDLVPGGVSWNFDAPTAQFYGALQGGTVESFVANLFGPDVRVRNPYDQDVVSDSHADDPTPLDLAVIPSDTYKPFQSFIEFRKASRKAGPDPKNQGYPIYLAFRIDGPDYDHVVAMVDHGIEVERHGGLQGTVTADLGLELSFLRSLDRPHSDAAGHIPLDWDAYDAVLFAEKAGLKSEIRGSVAANPNAIPATRDGVAYNVTYINSDDSWTHPDLYMSNPLNDNPFHHLNRYTKGGIALRVEFEVKDLRHGNEWIPAQLAAGASVVAGDLFGMFAYANTMGGGAFKDLLQGATVGEAFYRHTQSLGWRNIFIGDPLYRPFPGGRAPFKRK